MKKEKIISAVRQRLGETQVSDETIASVIDLVPIEEGTEPDDAYFDKIKAVCKSMQGNINAVAAKSVKDAKIEWEKKDTKKVEEPNPQTGDEAIKALQDQIKELKDSINNVSTRNAINAIRKGILDKSSELKVSKVSLWKDVVNSMEVTSESTSEKLLETAKATYEEKLKSYFGDGATPYGKADDSLQLDQKGAFDSFFNQMKSEGKMGEAKK